MAVIRHFKTITHHRHEVVKNCFRAGIGFQGLFHDLSKYSPTEFFVSAKNYQGNRSPNEKARELYGYSSAWLHHKGRNKHHFEYWNDLNPQTKRYEPVPMPDRYIIEMVCDRIAASKTYKKDAYTDAMPVEYLTRGTDRKNMHPETYEKLYYLLSYLKEHGEKALFRLLREGTITVPEELKKEASEWTH